MRLLLSTIACLAVLIAPAKADERRVTVHEIHKFVRSLNSAINNPNINVSKNFLDQAIISNASFNNRVSMTPHQAQYVWYNNPYYQQHNYRYPINPYYAPTNSQSLRKWDQINRIESKKKMIPGYKYALEVTNTNIQPYAQKATVDIDLKEYNLAYTPYSNTLGSHVLHANSRCKMYVQKGAMQDLYITRMDCNTNTSLPF